MWMGTSDRIKTFIQCTTAVYITDGSVKENYMKRYECNNNIEVNRKNFTLIHAEQPCNVRYAVHVWESHELLAGLTPVATGTLCNCAGPQFLRTKIATFFRSVLLLANTTTLSLLNSSPQSRA